MSFYFWGHTIIRLIKAMLCSVKGTSALQPTIKWNASCWFCFLFRFSVSFRRWRRWRAAMLLLHLKKVYFWVREQGSSGYWSLDTTISYLVLTQSATKLRSLLACGFTTEADICWPQLLNTVGDTTFISWSKYQGRPSLPQLMVLQNSVRVEGRVW